VIFAYVEGVRDGRALMASLRRALAAGKPVVMWKGGKTAQGARAAQSHTGNLTSTYDVYRTAMRQCGALEVSESEQAVDFLRAFTAGRMPRGRKVAIVTNTGGSAVVFSDAADLARLELAPLGSETRKRLAAALPPLASTANPVDTMAGYPRPEHAEGYCAAFEAILGDPHVDQLCVLFGTIVAGTFELSARVLAEATRGTDKPVFAFTAIPEQISSQGWDVLREARIPLFSTPSRAAYAMGLLADFAETRLRGSTDEISALPRLPALPPGAITLDEHESKAIIAAAGIPVTRDVLLPLKPAASHLSGVPFPVALKLVSRDVAHKSDIGAVRLNVAREALLEVAGDIVARAREAAPKAELSGLLACEMVTDGVETIVGVINDESFGPMVVFGLGGVFAEALQDVVFRIAPFGFDEAKTMISELRGHAMFQGARGRPPADVEALAHTLVSVSALAWALRDRLAELDINPLLVRPRGLGVVAADALVVLR
jgi:acetyltransferase